MTLLVLDSGAVSRLSSRGAVTAAEISRFRRAEAWPPMVPSVVLVECLSGRPHDDVVVHRFLKTCNIEEELPSTVARRAGELRTLCGRGSRVSAVDAVVIAMAEPDGVVLSADLEDLRALAAHTRAVVVQFV